MPKRNALVAVLSISLTILFFTGLANSASYYVRPDGNDSADGRSHDSAWRSISKVNGFRFSTGDDVYFLCGGTWTIRSKLSIDWNGTDSNPAVMGAYYYQNGREVIGVRGAKPTFDGRDVYPDDIDPFTAQYGTLLYANEQAYVTFQNLRIINSEGRGLNVANSQHAKAIGIETENTYSSGINFYRITHGLIENCLITDSARVEIEDPGHNWPAAIGVNVHSRYVTIRGNTLYDNYGEGIGLYKQANDCIVEDNTLYAIKKAGIYIDKGRRNIVRRNLVYGTTDRTFWRYHSGCSCRTPSQGIGEANENDGKSHNWSEDNVYYNNMIANCYYGFFASSAYPGSALRRIKFYNNTVIDSYYTLYIRNTDSDSDLVFANNIFYKTTSEGAQTKISSNLPGTTWSHNNWRVAPPAAYSSSSDIIGDPKLNKISGWTSAVGGDLKKSDFGLRAGSPLINQGRALGASYDQLALECSDNPNITLLDQDDHGDSWEIGCDVYNEVLIAPTLRIKISS